MKLIGWALAAIVALIAVAFAVHNFSPTNLDLWPLPYTVDMPIFAVVIIAAFFGFLAGAAVTWLASAGTRRRARERKREVKSLAAELDTNKRTQSSTDNAGNTARLPAPPRS